MFFNKTLISFHKIWVRQHLMSEHLSSLTKTLSKYDIVLNKVYICHLKKSDQFDFLLSCQPNEINIKWICL